MSLLSISAKKISKRDLDLEIEQIVSFILKYTSPNKIIIFGSAARDEAYQNSDIDVCVLYASKVDANNAKASLVNLDRLKFAFPIDFVLTYIEEFNERANVGGVFSSINETGIVVYPKV